MPHGRPTEMGAPQAYRVLGYVLMAFLMLGPSRSSAGSLGHQPLDEVMTAADLVALLVRVSPVPQEVRPTQRLQTAVVTYEVRRVLKSTRGVAVGDTIRIEAYLPTTIAGPLAALAEVVQREPEATYLGFLTWDEASQAYSPGAFSPQLRPGPGPAVRHPDTRGSTWLAIRTVMDLCPPVSLPVTYAEHDGGQACEGWLPEEMWFTLEDLEGQDWASLTDASYPLQHVSRCAAPYVLPSEPLGVVSLETSSATSLWKADLERCWQAHLASEPEVVTGRHVERLLVQGDDVLFPSVPAESVSPRLTRCVRDVLKRQGPLIGQGREGFEVELRMDLSTRPRWGVLPNRHLHRRLTPAAGRAEAGSSASPRPGSAE